MKLLTHPAVTGLGIATLCLSSKIAPLVSLGHLIVYHTSGSTFPLFASTLLSLLLLALGLGLLLHLADLSPRLRPFLWSALVCCLPILLYVELVALTGWTLPSYLLRLLLILALLVALLLASRTSLQSALYELHQLAVSILGFAAILGVFVMAELLWFGKQASHATPLPPFQPQTALTSPIPPSPRILWIVFDELSYQQIYERRYPGLQLPAFDQIAQQSTLFTHTIPAGIFTELVLPSLLTGTSVDRIRASADSNSLQLHNPNTLQWTTLQPHNTVFQDAQQAGLRTAVSGWYNPYCRILPGVLDRCYWSNRVPRLMGFLPNAALNTIAVDLAHRFFDSLHQLTHPHDLVPEDVFDAAAHLADFQDITTHANQLLRDPSLGFIFLHLPIPHRVGIYNRNTAQFALTNSTYLDNLALADRYLAHIHEQLQQQGQWDATTIVIMGDHSWRAHLVRDNFGGLAPEEQAASNGAKFDDRPAYLIKLPYQNQPARLDTPFHATQTRALLDALILQQLRTPNDLIAWATQHP